MMAVLLKENHIALSGGVKQALGQAHAYTALHARPSAMTAYEETEPPSRTPARRFLCKSKWRNLNELRQAVEAGADSVLLDNMSVAEAREAVALARQLRPERARRNFWRNHPGECPRLRRNGRGLPSSGSLTHSARPPI